MNYSAGGWVRQSATSLSTKYWARLGPHYCGAIPADSQPKIMKLGYAGQNISLGLTTGRGTVLRNVTADRVRVLIERNLAALRQILEFNARHRIPMFRISSRVIPFASHPANEIAWWQVFRSELASLGGFVRREGMRVSMHPGQYTILNSEHERVTRAAILDLEWHTRFLDAMGLDGRHKVVIHLGGAYGNKAAAMRRFVDAYGALTESIRRRVVVENDERIYSVEDTLAVSRETSAPVVVDTLHHRANPGREAPIRALLEAAFATWSAADGPPKVHFSSQAPAKRLGAHADYVDAVEFRLFLHDSEGLVFDCMIEAKAKDLAVLRLRADLGLGDDAAGSD